MGRAFTGRAICYGGRCLVAVLLLFSGVADAAETLRVGGTGAALQTIRLLAEAFSASRPAARIEVLPYVGSTGAIQGVASGALSLGVSARPASADEVRLPVRLVQYAITPLVIGSHPGVPAVGLTRQQLVDIYAARRTHWENGLLIRVILRAERETDNSVLRAISPEMNVAVSAALARPGMHRAPTDQDAADALERIPGALGPTTLALLLSEQRKIKVLAIDGITPSLATLRDGSYRHAKPLYLVLPAKSGPLVQAFCDFIISSEGRAILLANGQQPVVGGEAK